MEIKNEQKTSNKFCCQNCDYVTSRKSNYDRHVSTGKHKMEIMEIKNEQKTSNIYCCQNCDYITKQYRKYIEHTSSTKHQMEIMEIKNEQKGATYNCYICNKQYQTSAGLWKHKKRCEEEHIEKMVEQNNEPTDKELMMMIIKENSETKKMMLEILKNGINNNHSNNVNNANHSYNKTFNLQFFLNEQCKDAINITDFINSIQIQLEDLEETGRLGYVDGISRVVINNLNDSHTHKRPLHCTDSKREIMYIKNNDLWIKENENKDMIKNMIKQVANKNIRKIPEWVQAHPGCLKSDSRQNDKYLKIVSNSMSGITEEEQKHNINKIISKIAKQVIINK